MRKRRLESLIVAFAVAATSLPTLASEADDDGPVFNDLGENQSAAPALKVINSYLDASKQVHQCDLIIESHPGTVEDIYAGVCQLGNGRPVMVCGDTGIGQSGFKTLANGAVTPATRKALLDFTRENCPGG